MLSRHKYIKGEVEKIKENKGTNAWMTLLGWTQWHENNCQHNTPLSLSFDKKMMFTVP